MRRNLAPIDRTELRVRWGDARRRIARRVFRAMPRLTLLAWAEKYRRWADRSPYRVEQTPHMREILDAYSDPAVEEMAIMKPSQSGVTEGFILNAVGFHMDQEPRAIMVVIPSVDEAEKWSKKKLQPMVDATERLRDKLEEGSRKESNTMLEKALALDTPIPTPCGWTTMGDVLVGDTVFDESGRPCRVVWATDVMTSRPCYRVRFCDGEEVVADAGHGWPVEWYRVVLGKQTRVTDILTTRDIAARVRLSKRYKYAVRLAGPLDTPNAALPVDPYVLGVWLGDGLSHRPAITVGHADADEFKALIQERGVVVSRRKHRHGVKMFALDPDNLRRDALGRWGRIPGTVLDGLRSVGLLSRGGDGKSLKAIPSPYLRASYSQRLALLQGLMDTDGWVSADGGIYSITSVLPALADGIVELVTSLGMRPKRRTVATGYTRADGSRVQCGGAYLIHFAPHPDVPVFRLTRKLMRQQNRTRKWNGRAECRRIVSVESTTSVPVRCITVDSPSHLYLAGRGMVPTHNSFPGGSLGIVGSNSGRGFRMVTVGTVFGDDVDGWDDTAGKGAHNEGDQVTLIRRRTDRIPDRKLAWVSTPTMVGRRIHVLFQRMERQARFHVPCPQCGVMQILRWGGADTKYGIKWDQAEVGDDYELQPGEVLRKKVVHRPSTAYYACEANGCVIDESEKHDMELAGQYLCDDGKPARLPGYRSIGFWFNGLTITMPGSEWSSYVREFLEIKDDPDALRGFWNLILAEPWEDKRDAVDPASLEGRKAAYGGEVPDGVGILTAFVDVQGNRLELQVLGIGEREQTWVIAHHRLYGDPERPEVWQRLEALRTKAWRHELGKDLYIRAMGVDEGYLPTEVYGYVHGKEGQGVYAFDGQGGKRAYTLRRLKKPNRNKVRPWKVAVDAFKDLLFRRLRISEAGPGYIHFCAPRPIESDESGIFVEEGMDSEFFRQYTAETVKWQWMGGQLRRKYEKRRGQANEAIDLFVGCMAAFYTLGSEVRKNMAAEVEAARKGVSAPSTRGRGVVSKGIS